MGPTYYDSLEVSPKASDSVIRASYKALSQKHHPDKNLSDPERAHRNMARLNEAYEVLSDPDRRAAYDQHVRAIQELEGLIQRSQQPVRETPPPGPQPPAQTPPVRPEAPPAAASPSSAAAAGGYGWIIGWAAVLAAVSFWGRFQQDAGQTKQLSESLAPSSPTAPKVATRVAPTPPAGDPALSPNYPPSRLAGEPRRLYEEALGNAQARIPILDPDSPRFDARALDEVHGRARAYASKGLPAHQALMLGVADIEQKSLPGRPRRGP